MVDVFISYSRDNQKLVRQLAEAVKREGYSVWWDDELPPHLSYGDVIAEKIGSAKAAIVVWSEKAAASEWVRAEADVARGQRKLIQTSIDGRMPPMPFNQIQFAAIGDWRGETDHPGWRKVKQSLEALVGGSGEPRMHTIPLNSPPATAPTTRPPAEPPPADAGSGRWVAIAVIAILLLALAGAGAYLLTRAPGAGTDSAANGAAPSASGSGPRLSLPTTDAQFTQAAVIEAESADVRDGASAQTFVVARLNRGDVLTTFPQDGEWWRVRLADGRTGYIERERVRILDTADAAPAPVNRPAGNEDDLQPVVPGDVPGGQIVPFSSARLLSRADIADLSKGDLVLARNEIFARHGRIFRDPALRRHFSQFSWYRPREGEVRLSPLEAANVRLILREENER